MAELRRSRVLERLGDIVEARITRLILVVLIIVSLLPYVHVEEALRPLFLVVFGLEIGVRITLLVVRRKPTPIELGFAVMDLLAFASFLPLEHWLDAERVTALTMLRLSRLLVLVRFARELARDIYGIVTRREQLHQFGLITVAVFILAFVTAVVLSQLRMAPPAHSPEEHAFLDNLWWAFRQLESPDNLVTTVRVHPLLVGLSLGLTITGVFVVSYIIGIGANVVEQVLRTERLRPVDYRHHALVVGPSAGAEVLIREFIRIYAKNQRLRGHRWREIWAWLAHGGPPPRRHALARVALLGPRDEPPAFLHEQGMRWVVYRTGDGADPDALARVAAARANRAILLAPENAGHDVDAVTLMGLTALRSVNRRAQVYVELHGRVGCEIAVAVGGKGTFPLEVPRFLGLLLCQHLVVPGVERLYRDLLSVESSEFYTHIFVEPEEFAALARHGDERMRFAEMSRAAYRSYGIVLTGVFLGTDREPEVRARRLVTHGQRDLATDRLVQWLNPDAHGDLDPRVAKLGGKPGLVPRAALRGLIGVAESYLPIRRYAHALAHGRRGALGKRASSASAAERAVARMKTARGEPSRILVVGYSPALSSFLDGLARFVPDADIVVVMGARGDEVLPLPWRLEMLGIGLSHEEPPPGSEGRSVVLAGRTRVRVFTHEGPDLAGFAEDCVRRTGAVDAAVFLSEPQAVDRDARTAMRLLRFARGLELGRMPKGDRLHVLAEFSSLGKGKRIQQHLDSIKCGFSDEGCMRVTIVSTEEIKNYFMVHSSFVPGVTALYEELLSVGGQEIVRLDLGEADEGDEAGFSDLAEAMRARAVLLIALELDDGTVLLNPPPGQRFELRRVVAAYAIADHTASSAATSASAV